MRWFQNIYSLPLFASSILIAILLLSQPPPSEASSIRLCGTRLVQALHAICRNNICGGMATFKRSPFYRPLNTPVQIATWTPATRELFRLHHEQKRGGIATECCENRCTMDYLRTYCCNE